MIDCNIADYFIVNRLKNLLLLYMKSKGCHLHEYRHFSKLQ